ncbi:MAG: hypothetical protein WD492_06545 [Alkalispirochaeta sp.]
MNNSPSITIHGLPLEVSSETPSGRSVVEEGTAYYEIRDSDQMKPFLTTIVGSSNHWMYLSSSGGLTCGRRNPDHALFPYYTDDKIHESIHTTGPFTALRVYPASTGDTAALWVPFSDRYRGLDRISRRLLKSHAGDQVVLEEHNRTLGMIFRYTWRFSRRYGFVRTAQLRSEAAYARGVDILDGVRNVLPAGVDRGTQERASTLVDGYKTATLERSAGLAIYAMSSIITDRAEPSEALQAAVAWHAGLPEPTILLSEEQVEAFLAGAPLQGETVVRGRRGAFLVGATVDVGPDTTPSWLTVIDTDLDSAAVADLDQLLAHHPDSTDRRQLVTVDVQRGEDALARLVAAADGQQTSADTLVAVRHRSNVLFNIMRGGIFAEGYMIDRDDLRSYLETRNRTVARIHARLVDALPKELLYGDLRARFAEQTDPHLKRLVGEYLPLMFSRRHGDPSRPWNRFSIEVERADGSRQRSWQGNWRDIFQNWEALALSYPRYLPAMIATFLNASTADGYNPYRISRDGIDWEVLDPEDPWSNIGYWGDHQIVYLWRLLELVRRHEPGTLEKALDVPAYAAASVPYRIKPFEKIIENPYDSIVYDEEWAATTERRVADIGTDGKLYHRDGQIHLVSFTEKLLISVLTKVSNYVPDGGIWMNTQRPEWNDANNALAGWGLSVVTLAYVRRFLSFLLELFPEEGSRMTSLGGELARLLREIGVVLGASGAEGLPAAPLAPDVRYEVMERLGRAGTTYREAVYRGDVRAQEEAVSYGEIRTVLQSIRDHLDATIRRNRREDGLYHSYNILRVTARGATVEQLYEMLEGQVAILASGVLDAAEEQELLSTLRHSALYRPDVHSYLLYPDKPMSSFLEKNVIPDTLLRRSPWLRAEAERADGRIVRRDTTGTVRFHAAYRNAVELARALDEIEAQGGSSAPTAEDRGEVLEIYEEVFHHRSFTGRSGTFYKYEGLGSVYWHMVSKLNLAVLEAIRDGNQALSSRYLKIKEGIGIHKAPAQYGAIPVEPYSHTPSFAGAQQPGMTGQVKEDVIARFGELGVRVEQGTVEFRPLLLSADEFAPESTEFRYLDLSGEWKAITLPANALAFTYCQVPIVYHRSNTPGLQITRRDGTVIEAEEPQLAWEVSQTLFDRTGEIVRIDVNILSKSLITV